MMNIHAVSYIYIYKLAYIYIIYIYVYVYLISGITSPAHFFQSCLKGERS